MSNITDKEIEQVIKEAKFKEIKVHPFNGEYCFKWEYKDYLINFYDDEDIVLEKEGKKVDISEEQKEKLLAEFNKD